MIITSYRIQHFSVYRIYSQLLLYFFYSAILKVGIINFILQKSKWGSERLINLLKIPLGTNIRPKIGGHVFGLQEQYSLQSIPSSSLEKQISTPLPSPTQQRGNSVPLSQRDKVVPVTHTKLCFWLTNHPAFDHRFHWVLNWKTSQTLPNDFLCKFSKLEANILEFIIRDSVCVHVCVCIGSFNPQSICPIDKHITDL